MNLQDVRTFCRAKAELEALAEKYAQQYRRQDDHFNAQHFGKVEINEEGVAIKWYWHGGWGAEDEGWLNVPVEIILGPEESWVPYIDGVIKEKRAEAEREKEESARKRREHEISQAKAVLEREGLLPDSAKVKAQAQVVDDYYREREGV